MLNVLRDCCEAMLSISDSFWATAALTGASFETATSPDFHRALCAFAEAGLPPQLGAQLAMGVNGNLAAILEERHRHLGPFSPNLTWRGIRPDLHFGAVDGPDETAAEVKAVYDLTTRGFYSGKGHCVADDRRKLLKIRSEGFSGQLYQVVFFLQLPAFERPPGVWTASGARAKSWREFRVISGIERQYRYLRRFLPDEPVWPSNGPAVHPLRDVSAEVVACMVRRYTTDYRPDDPHWAFCPERHLVDAAAGCAIWRY